MRLTLISASAALVAALMTSSAYAATVNLYTWREQELFASPSLHSRVPDDAVPILRQQGVRIGAAAEPSMSRF